MYLVNSLMKSGTTRIRLLINFATNLDLFFDMRTHLLNRSAAVVVDPIGVPSGVVGIDVSSVSHGLKGCGGCLVFRFLQSPSKQTMFLYSVSTVVIVYSQYISACERQ